MAIQRYNHTIQKFLDQSVSLVGLKAMLLNAAATFTASHTTVSQVSNAGAYEVSGNGWAAGGELLVPTVSIITTDDAMFDLADIGKLAAGGSIGPASAVLVLSGTLPLFFQSFSSQEAGDGTPFVLTWNASGLMRVSG